MRYFPILSSTLVSLILFSTACYKEIVLPDELPEKEVVEVITFDGVSAFVDTTDGFMLFTLGSKMLSDFSPLVTFDHHEDIVFNGNGLLGGEVNRIGPVEVNHPYQLIAIKGETRDTFQLLFTPLPVIRISSSQAIPDEPKVLSYFEMQYASNSLQSQVTKLFESHAGVEIRGRSAALFEKKSYGLELWNNRYRDDRSAPLLEMRYGEDWILDAMYIDALRVRNKASFELWNKIAATPDGNLPDEGKKGIQMEYVELFINNRYNGLYCLGEKMNEQLIGFGYDAEENGAVMYKTIGWAEGSTMFETYNSEPPTSLIWSGWEQIYPSNTYRWEPLDELRKTIVLENDELFKNKIGTLIDLDNAADYYLFMNLILGYDNVGKNIFYARYSDQSPLFIVPWDLEATWGKMFNMVNSNTTGILGNHLFDRLIALNVDGFSDSLKMKWHAYRESVFLSDSLVAPFSRYYQIIDQSGAIERENARWSSIQIDFDLEYEYLLEWLEGRIAYLDKHLN